MKWKEVDLPTFIRKIYSLKEDCKRVVTDHKPPYAVIELRTPDGVIRGKTLSGHIGPLPYAECGVYPDKYYLPERGEQ